MTTLLETIEGDVEHLLDPESGFGETMQRADLSTFNAIIYDGMDEVEDARSPTMQVKTSDIQTRGETLTRVKDGERYTVEGIRYGPDGLSLVQLMPLAR